jgi:hypothetical protein
MGTSSVRQRLYYSGGGSLGNLNTDLNDKLQNTASIVDNVMRTFLPYLPNGNVKTPVYCAASELVRYAYMINEKGFENATVSMGIRVTKEYIIPYTANATWDYTNSNLIRNNLPYPTNVYAEKAFKRTMIEIMNEGADAVGERYRKHSE